MKKLLGLSIAATVLLTGCVGLSDLLGPEPSSPSVEPPVEVSPSASPSSASPTPTPSPTPSVPAVSDSITLQDADWEWRGGALAVKELEQDNRSAPPIAALSVWVPGMSSPVLCRLPLWEPDELWPGSGSSAYDVMATTGAEPKLLITYEATTQASGLTAQVSQGYVQTLDPAGCNLGPRTEIGTAVSGANSVGELTPRLAGATADVLLVETNRLGDVVALNAESLAVVWQETFEGYTSETREAAPGYIHVYQKKEGEFGTRSMFLSVADGSVLGASTDYALDREGVVLAPGRLLFNGVTSDDLHILEGTAARQVDVRGEVEFTAVSPTEFVAVGFFARSDETALADRFLGYIDAQGQVHEIVSAEQVRALDVELHSLSGGVLYLTTTAEFVTVGLDGAKIGQATTTTPDYESDGEDQVIGDAVYTLWEPDNNGEFYYVTKDGALPEER